MKTLLLTLCLLTAGLQNFAQQASWNGKFDNKADLLLYESKDGKYIIGTTKRDISVLDGTTGKSIWTNSFQAIADVKSCENQYFLEEAGVLFLSDKRLGKDNILCIDISDGKLLWKTDRFEGVHIGSIVYFHDLNSFAIITKKGLVTLEARTGEQLWELPRFTGSLADWEYLPAKNELVLLNFKTNFGALLSGFRNQLMKVNAQTGELLWESAYTGVVPTKFVTGSILAEMKIKDNRIFCLINGMQVFDLGTGNKLWEADFDLYDQKVQLGGEAYFYGGIAEPLVDGSDVYLVRFKHGSGKVFIEKRDLDNGEVAWTQKLDSKPDAIPSMVVSNGKLILQLGGYINIQGRDNNGTYSRYKWAGPYRLEAYDTAQGTLAWKTDKLKNRITTPLKVDNQIFVADDKHLYIIDPTTGATKSEKKLNALGTGDALTIYRTNSGVGLLGEKGFALVKPDLSPVFKVKMKEPYSFCPLRGETLLLMNKDEIRAIDLRDGKPKLTYKKEKSYKYIFDVGYILKHKSTDTIGDAIVDINRGGSPISPAIARKLVSAFATPPRTVSADAHLALLTPREREILQWLTRGFRYKEIAGRLFISEETVRTHIRNLYEKLQVQSRTEAINKIYGHPDAQ